MKILLIRHGETTGDIEDRYGGQYDDHLTDKGQEQLRYTASLLAGRPIEIIYSSPFIRAKESTAIINEVLQTEVKIVDDLRERNYGVLSGLTKAEAKERYPEAVEAHKDPSNTDPEGESQADFIARVIKAFQGVVEGGGDLVAVVAHGGSLKTILKHLDMSVPASIGDGEIIEVEVV